MNEKSNCKVLLLFVATIIAVLNDSHCALCVVSMQFSDRMKYSELIASHHRSHTNKEIRPIKALEKRPNQVFQKIYLEIIEMLPMRNQK